MFFFCFSYAFWKIARTIVWVVIKIVCITASENSTWLSASPLKYTCFNILQKRDFSQVDFKKSKLTNSHYRNFRIQIVFWFAKFKFSQQPKEIFLSSLLRCKGNWMVYIFASGIIWNKVTTKCATLKKYFLFVFHMHFGTLQELSCGW